MIARRTLPSPFVGAVEALVRERTGLVFRKGRRSSLHAAIEDSLGSSGTKETIEYLDRLSAEPAVLDDLVSRITVGETYFFREPKQVVEIREKILPALLRRRPGKMLRLWSAGCATGEEAYTLAILLHEMGLQKRAEVIATDVDRAALARAVRGRYGGWSFRGVPDEVLYRHFRRRGTQYELDPEIRASVDFRYLNLATDTYAFRGKGEPGADVILCRNVLIYFDRPTVTRVGRRLLDARRPDGWLILGAADPPLGNLEGAGAVITSGGLAYGFRKASGSPRSHVPRPARFDGGAFFASLPAPPASSPSPRWGSRGPSRAKDRATDRSSTTSAGSAPTDRTRAEGRATNRAPAEGKARPIRAAAEERLSGWGNEARSREEEAFFLYGIGEYEKVALLVSEEIVRSGGALALRLLLVRALANRGDLEGAERACDSAVERYPTSAELASLHAVLLKEGGRVDEAVRVARRARYLDRTLVPAHLALGRALAIRGDARAARRSFRKVEELLASLQPGAVVPGSDGELAGPMREMARVQGKCLGGAEG